MNALKDKIRSLPNEPGVYLFKDSRGQILYIGKAKSLRKRVQSYFSRPQEAKNQLMAAKIADLDYILTLTEHKAKLIEAELIRKKQPQYNIELKDGKSFPLIRISDELYPLVSISRRPKLKAGERAFYYGPYTNAEDVRTVFKMMRRIFGFRTCKTMPKTPCLYYRINLCPAPCSRKENVSRYRETIANLKLFLESRYEELVHQLTKKMQELAKERKFEEAAGLRDRINALATIRAGRDISLVMDELAGLQKILGLKKSPQRIEAFDISNICGQEATGSMVSFMRGLPDKNNYRRFRIKTVKVIDDYQMLREVIRRRYTRLLAEKLALPDAVLIDGGKGHLLSAKRELEKQGLDIPLFSIAKQEERIYVYGRPQPIRFKSDNTALNLIRRMRDEAHRFAVSYHRILRKKKMFSL